MRLSRGLLWALLVAGALTIVAPVVAWFFPIQLPDGQMVLAIGLMVDVHLVIAVICAVVLERGLARGWMRSGLVAAAISVLAWICVFATFTWLPYMTGQRIAIWPTIWACLMVVIGLLLLPRSHGKMGFGLRTTAIVLCAVLAASYCFTFTFHPSFSFTAWDSADYERIRRYDMITERIITTLALLSAGAVVLTFLSLLMRRLLGKGIPTSVKQPMWFECPRCGLAQTGTTGGCSCESCKLSIAVRLT